MKGFKSVILPILLLAFVGLGTGVAGATINVFVNATTPYDVLYQGQIASANVTVKNNENFPVRIYSVGVHYDWMTESVLSSVDFGGGYVQVESNSVTTPGYLLIPCGENVSSGYHSFYYKVALNWYNSYTGLWINDSIVQPGTVYVESPQKPEALQELQFANQSVAEARESGYMSRRAIDSVNNATALLNDGWSAYSTGDYARALRDTAGVIALTADAKVAEKNYRDNVTGIETIVVAVNEKLKSVSGTDDPDTLAAIASATGYLNLTRLSIEDEDFATALTNANLASGAADRAIQSQFYYSLKANQTEAERVVARAAIDAAQAALDDATDATSTEAQGILRDARAKLVNATILYDGKDYSNATIAANVATSLVDRAESDEAGYRMLLARNRIAAVGVLKSPEAKSMLANASSLYNQSATDFIASRFADCVEHADSAAALADSAAAAEKSWRDANPLSTVTPGFGILAALTAIGLALIIGERKL